MLNCNPDSFKTPDEPDEKAPGTVDNQVPPAGSNVQAGSILTMFVVKQEGEPNLGMLFSVAKLHKGVYYFCVCNAAQEIIGISYPFTMYMDDGKTTECVYPDCSKENTKAEAYLVNYETKQGP